MVGDGLAVAFKARLPDGLQAAHDNGQSSAQRG